MVIQEVMDKKMLPIATLFLNTLNITKMKILIFPALILTTILMSCGAQNAENTAHKHDDKHKHDDHATTDHHDGSEAGDLTSQTASIDALIAGYLKIKDALTKDDAKIAASAGKELFITMTSINETSFSDDQKKVFDEVMDDAKENAEHIGANADKLDHQREHFAMLSQDVDDLINVFGARQKLYQDFCPMYDSGKGAIWISETRDIKNPYYGSKMLSCGKMEKEL